MATDMIIVAAGVVSQNGKIMLCQRKPSDRLGLKWEFPGGKLEIGETPQQALERELREELDIETRTGRILDIRCDFSSGKEIMILFFRSEWLSGTPKTVDCNAIAWAEPSELLAYDLAPADVETARFIASDMQKTQSADF